MFSLFNPKKRHITIIVIALLFLQLWNNHLCAQYATINSTVIVIPPYGNKLSDYTSLPNKLLITLAVSGSESSNLALYLEGSITSDDGKIKISTPPGRKPVTPIIINKSAGGFFLPYQLTYPQIREIFNEPLQYNGITRNQVLQDGLPEGTYRISVKVISYNTNKPFEGTLSNSPFNVSNLDVPTIIQPMHQSQVQYMPVQSMVFSWTPPPGAPINTQYKLRIVEIKNNTTIQPADALRSASYPKFFETTVTGTTYLYSAANPALTPGKQYAFIVVANDPAGNVKFRNLGASQMHVFTYQQPQQAMSGSMPSKPPQKFLTSNINVSVPPMCMQTKVKGTLKYKYPGQDDTKTNPVKRANIKLVAKYFVVSADGTTIAEIDGFSSGAGSAWTMNSDYYANGPKPLEEIGQPVKTDDNGNFEFAFTTNYKMGLIDENFQCSPGGPAKLNDYDQYKNIAENRSNAKKDISNNLKDILYPKTINELSFTNAFPAKEVISPFNETGLYDNTGIVTNAIINSSKRNKMNSLAAAHYMSPGSCKLYRYYCIEFLQPHSNYYLNPDKETSQYILAQPGETVTANIVTKVRTMNLEVNVTSTITGSKTVINDNPKLKGVDVYLLRKVAVMAPGAGIPFPKDDVTPDKTDDYPVNSTSLNSYTIVGKATTSQDGKAVFNNLVFDDIGDYQYYIYANTPIREGQLSYYEDGVYSVSFTSLYQSNSSGGLSNYTGDLENHSELRWNIISKSYTFHMIPQFPSVYVELFDKTRRVSEDAQVLLKENWEIQSGDEVWWHYLSGPNSKYPSNLQPSYTMVRSDSALFSYTNLDMLIAPYPIDTVKGPKREILIKCTGYRDTTVTITETLKLGQKKYYPVFLKLGADVKGIVMDAETKKPVDGVAVRMSYNTNCQYTDVNGLFNGVPAKRLPGVSQFIIYQKDGYVSDSMEIGISNQHKTAPPMYLYKNFRRLKVHVTENYTGQPIKGIQVTLPDVKVRIPKLNNNLSSNMANSVQTGQSSPSNQIVNAQNITTQTGTMQAYHAQSANNVQVNSMQNIQPLNTGNQVVINASNMGAIFNNGSPDDGFIEMPLSGISDDNGWVSFAFRAQEDNDMMFKVVAENPESNPGNYVGVPISLKIPNGKVTTSTQYLMKKGMCIEGHIYAGETNVSPVDGATVKVNMGAYGTAEAQSNTSGNYKLRNVSCAMSAITIEVSKSGVAGDKVTMNTPQPSNTCVVQDFHLKTYEGIDMGKLLGYSIEPFIEEDKVAGTITMSGTLKNLATGNFKATEDIPFYGVKFVKDNQTNKWIFQGQEVNTTKNYVDVSLFNSYQGRAISTNGLKIERIGNTETGNINAKVRVDSTNFGGMGFSLPSAYLTNNKSTAPGFSVFSSAVGSGNGAPNSYYVCNPAGGDIRYTIKGFQDGALAKAEKSRFTPNGLYLNTILEANISSITPSNLNIDVGDIQFKKSGVVFSTTNPLNIGIGNWQLKCSNWTIGNEGLIVNSGVLATGADIPFENLRITSNMLKTDLMVLHFDKMKLLGVHDLVVTSNDVLLDYSSTWGGVSAWQVYVGPKNGQPTVGYILGLPGMAPGEKVEFSNILLNNQGENMLQMLGKTFKLYNFIDFTPNPGELLELTNDYFSIRGAYKLNIPYAETKFGDAVYYKNNNSLAYKPMYVEAMNFTHQGVIYKINLNSITDRLVIAKGTVEEPDNLPALNVTLSHTPTATKIDIDPGQKIKLGTSKYLDQVAGGINVANHQWQTFRFDGYPKGMGGISENNQKLSFEVTGAVKATGQSIGVSEIPAFPGMTLTYDMVNSRLLGYCDLNMNLGGMALTGGVNAILDGNGWIFQADGSMEVPGLGGMNMFGLFGNYSGIPAEFASKFGSALCLPASFTQHIKGFFLTAGITKQILPKFSQNLGIVTISAGVDLSLDARVFMQFGGGGSVYGIGVLARGNAYAIGECDATCTTLNASASLQAGISGNYSAGTFNVDGCTSLSLGLTATQCFPLVPMTGICGPCFSVSLPSITLGATMHMDSGGGFNMDLTTSSCDQQCH